MLEKFANTNKADNIRRWLNTVDLNSADILSTERSIYSALVKGNRKEYWLSTPVAPLAEPVDMTELVGDLFTGANEEILYHGQRVDNFYTWLSETNNVLKAELESVEKIVTQATDDIQDITIVIGDENRHFYWVSDSFNNNTYVDLKNSSCLIDTDYGMAILSPKELQSILGFDAVINREVTSPEAIPGANLYIVNPGKSGTQEKEPEPTIEKEDTRNFGALFDADSSTWFEVERNFIPKRQRLLMKGRAFTPSESGEEKDVEEVTVKYDWTAIVTWPDGYQDGGADGKGKPLAEWRDINTETSVLSNALTYLPPGPGTNNSPDIKLAFNLALKEPTNLSSIKLLPFVREDSAPIVVESLDVIADGHTISVIKDVELGTNRSTTKLQREILRRTGVQLLGSVFSIPTDRNISEIRVVLTSKPSPVKYGFAHIFKDVYREYRTERNHVLWRSVNTWKEWGREPYDTDPPKITSKYERPAIVGVIAGAANVAYTLGNAFNSAAAAAKLAGTAFKLGGTLGAVGTWLGRAVPWIGAILALDQLVGGFFSIQKSVAILEGRVGYDIFKGYRSAIGLRDLTLVKTTYTSESVIQSIKRDFPGPVSKVGLFVDEYIPEHWGAGDWITYFVSSDGINWVNIPKLTDATLDKSLNLPQPSKSIYFKATLKGNSSDIYHSPQLKHYSLQGLPSI